MKRPSIAGIHHLKFNVSDLGQSLRFYETVLGAKRVTELDHHRPNGDLFAYILDVENLGTRLELRFSPEAAAREARQDPVTLSVKTRGDLVSWHDHLETNGIPHSRILTGVIGWLLVMEDPDVRRIRFYSVETHPFITDVSKDRYWLGD